jgi:hypothetical protein
MMATSSQNAPSPPAVFVHFPSLPCPLPCVFAHDESRHAFVVLCPSKRRTFSLEHMHPLVREMPLARPVLRGSPRFSFPSPEFRCQAVRRLRTSGDHSFVHGTNERIVPRTEHPVHEPSPGQRERRPLSGKKPKRSLVSSSSAERSDTSSARRMSAIERDANALLWNIGGGNARIVDHFHASLPCSNTAVRAMCFSSNEQYR